MDVALVAEAELVEVPLEAVTATVDVGGLLGGLRGAGLVGWLRTRPDPRGHRELVLALREGRPVVLRAGTLSADVPADQLLAPLLGMHGFGQAPTAVGEGDLEATSWLPWTRPVLDVGPEGRPDGPPNGTGADVADGAHAHGDGGVQAEAPDGPGVIVLYLLSGGRPVSRAHALEVAALLGTDVVMVPAGRWTVVVPVDGSGPPGYGVPWSGSHRPVLSLVGRGDDVDVTVHLAKGERRPVSQWALARTLPGWSWSPAPDRVEHLVCRGDLAGLDEDVRRAVLLLQAQADEAPVARALELDATRAGRLRQLLDAPATPTTATDLSEVLGLPDVVPALLAGRLCVQELPGAVTAERRGTIGVAVESMLSRPDGTSLISRLRRWDHDRPTWSVAYIAVEVVLAVVGAVIGTAEASPLSQRPWDVVFGLAAVVLGVDAVGNTVLLAAVRRRTRRA